MHKFLHTESLLGYTVVAPDVSVTAIRFGVKKFILFISGCKWTLTPDIHIVKQTQTHMLY